MYVMCAIFKLTGSQYKKKNTKKNPLIIKFQKQKPPKKHFLDYNFFFLFLTISHDHLFHNNITHDKVSRYYTYQSKQEHTRQ